MTNSMNPSDINRTIESLIDCNCRFANPIYRDDCRHDARQRDLRNLLIDIADPDLESDCAELLRSLLTALIDAPYSTQTLSMMRLDNSLCPMHAIDYAICFDDADADCDSIRAYFPDHDT